jgi:hypothetical protein
LVPVERLPCDLGAQRVLASLVLGAIDKPKDPLDKFGVEPVRDQFHPADDATSAALETSPEATPSHASAVTC